MTCKHKQIRTWVFEDTEEPSGLWSCVDCSLKFEPITKRTWIGLTNNEIALIHADYPHPQGFARAIEKKLKQKNGHA